MFGFDAYLVRAAGEEDRAALTRFCLENPEYDVFLTGKVPAPNAWVDDFLYERPPATFNWTATHKLIASSSDQPDDILAIMDVSEDMIAKNVAHIGLLQVATARHGAGFAGPLYFALERWLHGRGSDVIRLGVLEGNARGTAFWARHGYVETRTRSGIAPTGKTHLSHVLYKPLVPMSLEQYRARVPRDDPANP